MQNLSRNYNYSYKDKYYKSQNNTQNHKYKNRNLKIKKPLKNCEKKSIYNYIFFLSIIFIILVLIVFVHIHITNLQNQKLLLDENLEIVNNEINYLTIERSKKYSLRKIEQIAKNDLGMVRPEQTISLSLKNKKDDTMDDNMNNKEIPKQNIFANMINYINNNVMAGN